MAAIAVSIFLIVGIRNKPVPEIEASVPPVGSPGDVIVIKGKNFGEARDMSYVEFAGSKLTASSYISWDNDTIKLVLPSNIQDGLVVVGVNNQRSKPALFANEVDIPVP
ncbi:MAG: IPT/TIG domain-containing protein, partial [Treponema sp.]|nr:IPT/TIG domain-containing protein [Treponema sp.]